MADENDVVKYSFEGDSSGLQQATSEALACLNSYDNSLAVVQNQIRSVNQGMTGFFATLSQLLNYISTYTSYQDTASNAAARGSTYTTAYANALLSANQALSQAAAVTNRTTQAQESSSRSTQNSTSKWAVLADQISIVINALEDLKPKIPQVSANFDALKNSINFVTSALKTYLGIDLVGTFQKSAMAAMTYVESLNLFTVVMDEAIDKGTEFTDAMSEMYGLDTTSIMDYTSAFQSLAKAAGAPTEASADLSTGLMALSTDIASLYNTDVETAAQRLRSSMLGMQRSASQLGADIRVSTLQLYANKIGLEGNVEAMSEANRQGLRYLALIDQLSFAQGDWAKTIENPSNQLRILKEQLRITAREIGNTFLGALKSVLPYINGAVMALNKLIHYVAVLLGFNMDEAEGSVSTVDSLADSTANVGTAAKKSAKEVQKLIAPFDELNVLSKESPSKSTSDNQSGMSEGMDPKLAAAISAMTTPLKEVEMRAHKVRDAILEFLNLDGGAIERVINRIKATLNAVKQVLVTLKGKLSQALTYNGNGVAILNTFKGILSDIADWFDRIIAITQDWADNLNLTPLVTAFRGLSEAIRNLLDSVGDDLAEFYKNVLLPLGKWTIEEAVPNALKKLTDALNWFADHPGARAAILGIVGAIAMLVQTIKTVGTVISIMKSVTVILNTVSAIAAALGVSVGALAWEILAVVAAVAAVIAVIVLLVTHLDEIKAWFDNIQGKIRAFVDTVQTKFDEVKAALDTVKQKLVDFFQPFIDTVQAAKNKFDEIKNTVSANVQIILNKFEEIKETLFKVFTALWNYFKKTIIDPIKNWFQKHIIEPITQFYNKYVKPVIDKISKLFQTIFNWISKKVQAIANVFVKVFNWVRNAIAKIFNAIVTNIVNAFVHAINNVIGFFEDLVNGIVSAVNLLVRVANKVSPTPIDYVGEIHLGRVSYMATGGVVTRPTQAIVGEGKYNEAVIPLGNSPQLNEMLDKFADKVNNQPVNVNVIIGGKKWDAEVYKAAERGKSAVGTQFLGSKVKV